MACGYESAQRALELLDYTLGQIEGGLSAYTEERPGESVTWGDGWARHSGLGGRAVRHAPCGARHSGSFVPAPAVPLLCELGPPTRAWGQMAAASAQPRPRGEPSWAGRGTMSLCGQEIWAGRPDHNTPSAGLGCSSLGRPLPSQALRDGHPQGQFLLRFPDPREAEMLSARLRAGDGVALSGGCAYLVWSGTSGDCFWGAGIPRGLRRLLISRGPAAGVVAASLGPGEEFFVRFQDAVHWSGPPSLGEALRRAESQPEVVAFGPKSSWYVKFSNGQSEWRGLPQRLSNHLIAREPGRAGAAAKGVEGLSMGPGGEWWVKFWAGSWAMGGARKELLAAVEEVRGKGGDVAGCTF
eukprot:CAMPEP_0182888000 /NCGR_PEP_ID=MMETSP0034_2-20130328/21162_1 /TAXON_ID=156128 /ORGANISM="Nephroselmis pyriformis, Strain CCMP717" /LENGTH=353 /DNA_ID=CAMNT_0025021397 /DNA_START=83 /DNA_END=1141 /DNA_ORIENTATION=+